MSKRLIIFNGVLYVFNPIIFGKTMAYEVYPFSWHNPATNREYDRAYLIRTDDNDIVNHSDELLAAYLGIEVQTYQNEQEKLADMAGEVQY